MDGPSQNTDDGYDDNTDQNTSRYFLMTSTAVKMIPNNANKVPDCPNLPRLPVYPNSV